MVVFDELPGIMERPGRSMRVSSAARRRLENCIELFGGKAAPGIRDGQAGGRQGGEFALKLVQNWKDLMKGGLKMEPAFVRNGFDGAPGQSEEQPPEFDRIDKNRQR